MINIEPIGIVHNDYIDPHVAKAITEPSAIEIFPQFTDALLRVTEHSHIWVIGWFHKAKRDVLKVIPRVNKELPEYGVFGVRAYSRPNPIGLTVVKLEEIKDNILYVKGLDFIDGTPIIDIKPYYEKDIVFSADTPYIKPKDPAILEEAMMKEAIKHHQEKCEQLVLAVKMCLAAEKEFGNLTAGDLKISIKGSRCLADTVQGLTRARLANPERFYFQQTDGKAETRWEKGSKTLIVTLKNSTDMQGMNNRSGEELLDIEVLERKEL